MSVTFDNSQLSTEQVIGRVNRKKQRRRETMNSEANIWANPGGEPQLRLARAASGVDC